MITDTEIARYEKFYTLMNKILDKYTPLGDPDRLVLFDDIYELINLKCEVRTHELLDLFL